MVPCIPDVLECMRIDSAVRALAQHIDERSRDVRCKTTPRWRRWVKPVRWYHAFAVSDQGMRAASLDERRVERPRLEVAPDAGWHLSYFMSLQEIRRKARPILTHSLMGICHSPFFVPAPYILKEVSSYAAPAGSRRGRVSSLWSYRV